MTLASGIHGRTITAAQVEDVLDVTSGLFEAGRVRDGMSYLTPTLSAFRRGCSAEQWRTLASSVLLAHPLNRLLQQDPFTGHSFRKPRGYAGDAGLLDLIYNPDEPPPGTSATGAAVWQYSINVPEPAAVRERKRLLAGEIQSACDRVHAPRVFAVACGHLREGAGSRGMMDGQFRRGGAAFFALDQDPASLATVATAYGHLGVRTLPASVRSLLGRRVPVADVDLAYAAGLYDYLSGPLAVRLTAELFRLLRPGGKLLVANFAVGTFSVGYMESYMDWHLIYRDEVGMRRLAADVPADQVGSVRAYAGENGHVLYLEVVRAG